MTCDFGDSGDRRALRAHPTRPFSTFIANKGTSSNRPMGDPCVALGWPLGGPSVAQGPPNPNPRPNPSRQRVATRPTPSFGYLLAANCQMLDFQRSLPPTAGPLLEDDSLLYHLFASVSSGNWLWKSESFAGQTSFGANAPRIRKALLWIKDLQFLAKTVFEHKPKIVRSAPAPAGRTPLPGLNCENAMAVPHALMAG
jgi:hypothetical protein